MSWAFLKFASAAAIDFFVTAMAEPPLFPITAAKISDAE
jgi:hypothetical protein